MSSSAGKRERRNKAEPGFVDGSPSTDDSIAKRNVASRRSQSWSRPFTNLLRIWARSDEKKRLNAAADALEEELGTLSTSEQIANGSHYRSMLGNGAEDNFKDAVWWIFVQKIGKSCDKDRLWNEMTIYLLIGQTSHFLVPDEELDKQTLHKLKRTLELWVFLAVTEKLHLLLQHQDYKQVRELKDNGASPAAVFQAFVSICKNRAGINRWTRAHMNNVRYTIYEVVLHVRQGGDVPHQAVSQTSTGFAEDNNAENIGRTVKSDMKNEVSAGSPQSVRTLAPRTAHSQDMSALQTTSSTSPTPATSRPSKTQNSLLSNPPSAFNEDCLERVTKKIVKFQTDLEAAEANLSDRRKHLQEAEAASEQAKVNFRNLGRNIQLSDFDILDGRGPEEWTPAALERQVHEIEKLAQMKREALFALSELVDKERLAGADLKRAEEWLKKCREGMEKLIQLMDLARELDED